MGIDNLQAFRKELAHLLHLGLDRVRGVQGVGARGLADGDARGGPAVEGALDVVDLRAQLGPAHVADPHDRPVRVGAYGNRGELVRGREHVLDHDGGVQALALHRGRAAELAGRDLDVVGLDRGNHVFDGQAVVSELVRIEPHPHGIPAAEYLDLAHAGHACQDPLQVGLGEVSQVGAVHAAGLRDQAHDKQVVVSGLDDVHALVPHHVGKARQARLHLVLNLGPGNVRVRARGKGELDARSARRIARGGHVQQPVQPGHPLLDDLGHTVFNSLCRGPRVGGVDGDGGRGHLGVLGDGQAEDRQPACRHDDDGDDPRKDRAVEKEFRKHGVFPLSSVRGRGR